MGVTTAVPDGIWIEERSCGCVTAAMLPDWGDGEHVYRTRAEAEAHLRPQPWEQARAEQLGLAVRLVSQGEFRSLHGDGRWNCPDHTMAQLIHGAA